MDKETKGWRSRWVEEGELKGRGGGPGQRKQKCLCAGAWTRWMLAGSLDRLHQQLGNPPRPGGIVVASRRGCAWFFCLGCAPWLRGAAPVLERAVVIWAPLWAFASSAGSRSLLGVPGSGYPLLDVWFHSPTPGHGPGLVRNETLGPIGPLASAPEAPGPCSSLSQSLQKDSRCNAILATTTNKSGCSSAAPAPAPPRCHGRPTAQTALPDPRCRQHPRPSPRLLAGSRKKPACARKGRAWLRAPAALDCASLVLRGIRRRGPTRDSEWHHPIRAPLAGCEHFPSAARHLHLDAELAYPRGVLLPAPLPSQIRSSRSRIGRTMLRY